tara:strand:- start:365 stop:1918 length:1554 start_codon:yes stop_codon:yes gene_type:complete
VGNFSIIRNQHELNIWKKSQKAPIHFVPTMGSLHEGHYRLIQSAQKPSCNRDPVVLLSVFVNPLQFGPKEDFEKYPRNLEIDFINSQKQGANAVWAPSIDEIFPGNPQDNFKLIVPPNLTKNLCGKNRQGHFDGVITVIARLLSLVKPEVLVLGEKDWQQMLIIKNFLDHYNLPINLRTIETIRDEDGLAYSSRNKYLNPKERNQALMLPKVLKQASLNFQKNKKINLNHIKTNLIQNGLEVEYLELVEPYSLVQLEPNPKPSLLAAAVRCGKTRLIDHTFLMHRKPIVAIDGPAGAGKSTVTKSFAKKLNLIYLDTGAMYRAVTLLLQQKNIDLNDDQQIKEILEKINLEIDQGNEGNQKIIINGQDVTQEIRTPAITSKVSQIAKNKFVRETLTDQQRKIGDLGGIVAEGRDIGSTVFPDAELKIYLTASVQERAIRRSLDLKEKGFDVPSIEIIEKQINERDYIDSNREISPLIKSDDAIELITDGMSINEVIDSLISLFETKIPQEIWPTSFQ